MDHTSEPSKGEILCNSRRQRAGCLIRREEILESICHPASEMRSSLNKGRLFRMCLLPFVVNRGLRKLLPGCAVLLEHTEQTIKWADRSPAALCPRAVVTDWVLPTPPSLPPSLTCPARSLRLLSVPSAAVSRSKKGVKREGEKGPGSAKRPHHHRWHCPSASPSSRVQIKQRYKRSMIHGATSDCLCVKFKPAVTPCPAVWPIQYLRQQSQKTLRPTSAIAYTGRTHRLVWAWKNKAEVWCTFTFKTEQTKECQAVHVFICAELTGTLHHYYIASFVSELNTTLLGQCWLEQPLYQVNAEWGLRLFKCKLCPCNFKSWL